MFSSQCVWLRASSKALIKASRESKPKALPVHRYRRMSRTAFLASFSAFFNSASRTSLTLMPKAASAPAASRQLATTSSSLRFSRHKHFSLRSKPTIFLAPSKAAPNVRLRMVSSGVPLPSFPSRELAHAWSTPHDCTRSMVRLTAGKPLNKAAQDAEDDQV